MWMSFAMNVLALGTGIPLWYIATRAEVELACEVEEVHMSRLPTILVVDDTPRNIKLLDALLTPRGYTVVPAGSGREALEKVASEQPDLILLDIVMPGMDGYEVCRRLRDDPATRLLPIIMITASGEQEKIKAIEAGADDFIVKPLN